jgi:hypothetical protein
VLKVKLVQSHHYTNKSIHDKIKRLDYQSCLYEAWKFINLPNRWALDYQEQMNTFHRYDWLLHQPYSEV